MLASYTALDLASRIHTMNIAGKKRLIWSLAGAGVMGTGVWAMHFVGMLAFRMPVAVGYDLKLTMFSLFIPISFSFLVLEVITKRTVGGPHLVLGSICMGLAIAAMHYTGMMALRMQPSLTYDYTLVAASVAIAIVAAWMSLWIASRLWQNHRNYVLLKRCSAGLILGLAMAGMHYTGMSAAHFSSNAVSGASNSINSNWLATIVASLTLTMMLSTLICLRIDKGHDLMSNWMEASLDNAHHQLINMATHDPLTGLANRTSLLRRIQDMIIRSEESGRPFTVLFTELDGLKTVNDSLGHAGGDSLLAEFALRLTASVQEGNMVARMGGDEFVILLEGVAHAQEVTTTVADILQRMQQEFVIAGTPLRLTASIGLASHPADGKVAEDLLKFADLAMCDAKQSGSNAFRFYTFEMSKIASRTWLLYRALAEAFDKQELSLHFQPKFDGLTQQFVGAEALIRWHHPELGNISPNQFIPIAEETGQIVRVGNWTIREVCRHINEWDDDGLPRVKIAINLSPDQLCYPRYVDIVLAIMSEAGLTPDRIMFEITETASMRDARLSTLGLQDLQNAGFEVAIDDFGTGHSSLAYLQQFRVKQLKIDKSFIRSMDFEDPSGTAIVRAIIAMAHALNMIVVAEGVETLTQLLTLQDLGCDELQGFFLSKPLDAKTFRNFLQGNLSPFIAPNTLIGNGLLPTQG